MTTRTMYDTGRMILNSGSFGVSSLADVAWTSWTKNRKKSTPKMHLDNFNLERPWDTKNITVQSGHVFNPAWEAHDWTLYLRLKKNIRKLTKWACYVQLIKMLITGCCQFSIFRWKSVIIPQTFRPEAVPFRASWVSMARYVWSSSERKAPRGFMFMMKRSTTTTNTAIIIFMIIIVSSWYHDVHPYPPHHDHHPYQWAREMRGGQGGRDGVIVIK